MAEVAGEAAAIVVALEGIDFLLDAIGFNDENERARIMEAGLADYEDFRYLVAKDISGMADEFAK
jgi:hypothetical protein